MIWIYFLLGISVGTNIALLFALYYSCKLFDDLHEITTNMDHELDEILARYDFNRGCG